MTLEITKTDAYGNVTTETTPVPTSPDPVINSESAAESAQELWVSIQTKNTAFFDDALSSTINFFKQNQQLLTTLGLILLGIIGIRLLFAGLDAIDGIPLVTPLLKLVGLFYVGRFIWRYLIKEQNRQELMQIIERTKAEVLGDRN
jgi:CAAD domains of cyanobacterial aminoacyl-tRNA synthetase